MKRGCVFSFLSQMSLKEKSSIQDPRFDYYTPQEEEEVELRDDELSHIIEIYDFPAEFKTEDLIRSFSSFQSVNLDSTTQTCVTSKCVLIVCVFSGRRGSILNGLMIHTFWVCSPVRSQVSGIQMW